jgi:hypothetical protein
MPGKKPKSKGAPVAKTSSPTPSYIKTKQGKFDITKTATGKIKVTKPNGFVITFPKGTNVNKIASQLQSGSSLTTAALSVPGTKMKSAGGAKMKVRSGGMRGGAGIGGMFGVKNR